MVDWLEKWILYSWIFLLCAMVLILFVPASGNSWTCQRFSEKACWFSVECIPKSTWWHSWTEINTGRVTQGSKVFLLSYVFWDKPFFFFPVNDFWKSKEPQNQKGTQKPSSPYLSHYNICINSFCTINIYWSIFQAIYQSTYVTLQHPLEYSI